jgi:hypothetical protein
MGSHDLQRRAQRAFDQTIHFDVLGQRAGELQRGREFAAQARGVGGTASLSHGAMVNH